MPDAEIEYFPGFFDADKATSLFKQLQDNIPWQQDAITVFGKTHPQPRLTALFGNEGKPYACSNIVTNIGTNSSRIGQTNLGVHVSAIHVD